MFSINPFADFVITVSFSFIYLVLSKMLRRFQTLKCLVFIQSIGIQNGPIIIGLWRPIHVLFILDITKIFRTVLDTKDLNWFIKETLPCLNRRPRPAPWYAQFP